MKSERGKKPKGTAPMTAATGNGAGNKALHQAKAAKKDEFYTQMTDIERELKHYRAHFRNKVVYCNCDDPRVSNFFRFFYLKFDNWGLKKLIATCYKSENPDSFSCHDRDNAIRLECEGGKERIFSLDGDGDFRSEECVDLLKQSDIVVTNPPFSLFREYVAQLMEHDKKFLILGDQNAITYKEIFKLIKEDKLWLGCNNGGIKWFGVQDHYDIKTESRKKVVDGKKYFSMGRINWYTNLNHKERHKDLILYKRYSKKEYPAYDNYKAIEVSKVSNIPENYKGLWVCPSLFLANTARISLRSWAWIGLL